MKSCSRTLPFFVAALLVATCTAQSARADDVAPSGVRSLEDCIEFALEHNVDARDGEADVSEARAVRDESRGALLPRLRVEGNLLEWNVPYALPFGPSSFVIHSQTTGMFSMSIIEPLTPLFAIYDQYEVGALGIDVARVRREATRRDVAFRAAQAYMELLKSERIENVQATSVRQLEASLQQAQSLFDHGVLGKNDLLRADLALAEAKQQHIAARGQVSVQKGILATAMGLGADAQIDAAPWTREPKPMETATVESVENRAVANRLEVKELIDGVAQAEKIVAAAKLKYLPEVSAVANYTHVAGSPLQQVNAGYIGLQGAWDVLDGGKTAAGISKAKAKLERARSARTRLEDGIRLEARRAYVAAKSASEALGVARVAVAQADENFRIVSKRFEAAASTSFDVVDAESLLTRARAREQTALYDYLIARAAVQRATGAMRPKAE